jgi:hypothetical protein
LHDITGEDLEMLSYMFEFTQDTDVFTMCSLLQGKVFSGDDQILYNVKKFPIRFVYRLFKIFLKDIVSKEYIDKISWLKAAYYMQKSSFRDVTLLEKIPMNKFLAMLAIHKEAVEHANSQS